MQDTNAANLLICRISKCYIETFRTGCKAVVEHSMFGSIYKRKIKDCVYTLKHEFWSLTKSKKYQWKTQKICNQRNILHKEIATFKFSN